MVAKAIITNVTDTLFHYICICSVLYVIVICYNTMANMAWIVVLAQLHPFIFKVQNQLREENIYILASQTRQTNKSLQHCIGIEG